MCYYSQMDFDMKAGQKKTEENNLICIFPVNFFSGVSKFEYELRKNMNNA